MEEINLKELFEYFIDKIYYIIIFTMLMMSIGCVYATFFQTPKYDSSTSLILTGFSTTTEDGSIINNNDLNINQQLLPTYQQIIRSRKVLNQVIVDLQLDYKVEELAGMITVSSVNDTEIIKITVSAEEPILAYNIATETARVFSSEVKSIYNVSNVSVLDTAEVPEERSDASVFKVMFLAALIGVFVSCACIFVVFYFDTTIKSVEQIEQKFNIPILGTVPDYNNKINIKNRKGEKDNG